ncbi:triacylglycerol lipase [Saccharopolyspora karakumensis]|uniref:Triacylglycerol lipase n=1 Tax=Saccharopolyspora karakumensis TaxID=2530386 RepID=A0A4R5C0H6_9PSEU|nr:lipase family protein [Saccharopolyspora karakumensis]TDD91260.1 triacylglycerol lipase [Saccharopolyspora karakumensis]
MPRSAHHPPAVRRLVTATALSLFIAGSQAVPAIADDAPSTPGMVSAGFYDPPAELPAADGALVRTEELPLALSLPSIGGQQMPGTATRLMYKTTDSNGQPAAVTGAYIEPSAPWRGEGPRPLVAVAPGTMGQGDSCSASMGLERPINFDGNSVSVGYEDIAIYRLLAEGAAVVVTDYVGLGTTDRLHTYVNRVDGGHAVLDAVRAARQLPDASVTPDSRVALYGYSQGGGATASAAELQPDYAPDVALAGAYVGAPPANLIEVIEGIDGSVLVGALGWSLNGFIQTHPELQSVADEYLNEDGKAALETLSTSCVGDGIARFAFRRSAEWTTTGQTLGEVAEAEPAVRDVLDDQLIGTRKPATAVRVVTGVQDDVVPHDQARQLAVDWCDQGGEVTYQPIQVPDLGKGLMVNHITPLLADQTNAISWLTDRLSGAAAINNCNTLPDQP